MMEGDVRYGAIYIEHTMHRALIRFSEDDGGYWVSAT